MKQICKRGHDTFITGRDKDGHCKACVKLRCKKRYKKHKLAILAYSAKWKKEHPEKMKNYWKKWYRKNKTRVKAHHLKNVYNMTLEQYDLLKLEQNGVCKICFTICKTGKDLSVDHDHKTNKIRGLLCDNCNHVLGLVNDNVAILTSCIKYLNKNK